MAEQDQKYLSRCVIQTYDDTKVTYQLLVCVALLQYSYQPAPRPL